jgi:DMSO/TMAO reductase YedYZ molybdopterin-dependent catalytic subunit
MTSPKPSLVQRKERWARKMAAKEKAPVAIGRRSTDRLPPGQHLTQGFPILDLGIKPEIALADWPLEIGGLVDNPRTFTSEEFECSSTVRRRFRFSLRYYLEQIRLSLARGGLFYAGRNREAVARSTSRSL